MKSIKLKITVSIILCSLLTTSFIGLISMSDIRRISNEAAENELTLNSELTASEMQAQLNMKRLMYRLQVLRMLLLKFL